MNDRMRLGKERGTIEGQQLIDALGHSSRGLRLCPKFAEQSAVNFLEHGCEGERFS